MIIKKNNLNFEIQFEEGNSISGTLKNNEITSQSKIKTKKLTWNEFKEHISEIDNSKLIFRGQKEPWPLRTSFHRNGRLLINQFLNVDVKQLHNRLSSITRHYFKLQDAEQNGAFVNLLQHHGYPTPLLDWTHSPYVAAFFAFRQIPKNVDVAGDVRIYIFNKNAWQNNYQQFVIFDTPFPHFSLSEFKSLENPRHVPQQSIITVTNIDDIESFIQQKEEELGLNILFAIDIPASERQSVIDDLRIMGITAGSMFPGIDGVCEELRETNFTN